MKSICLTKNKSAVVDDEDFNSLNQYKWCFGNKGYAVRRFNGRILLMHRLILNTPEGFETDHINGNGLDNRRSNLRVATRQQNSSNKDKYITNKSGYKGVSWCKRTKKWLSHITFNYKAVHLGYFNDIEDAKNAYIRSAKEYFGLYAKGEIQ